MLVKAELGHLLLEGLKYGFKPTGDACARISRVRRGAIGHSATRFGAAHRAVKQVVHSVPTTVCVEFLSEKCRGVTKDPMHAFLSIAILTGLRFRAPHR